MPSRTTNTDRGLANVHADFLSHVAALKQVTNRPAPLSVDQHAAHRKKMEDVRYIKPKYALETQINISTIQRKWQRYCEEMNFGDWKEKIKRIHRTLMQDFFLWQLYTNVTGSFVDRNDMKEVYKYHAIVLIPRFGLRAPNIDGKPVLNVDSLLAILTFNIAFDTGTFPLELQRVNLSGCYMVLCYTGARPAELVNNEKKRPKDGSFEKLFGSKVIMSNNEDGEATDESSSKLDSLLCKETIGRDRPKALCYEDILMMIVRDPVTGRCVPAMSIKFIHHKGCDNKPKPTIFFFTLARKVIFCPILLFLSIALFDHAFDAECLEDAKSLLGTEVPNGRQCLPLRWKKSKLKTPFFRRVVRDGILSEDEAMFYSTLKDNMSRQSLEAGFEKAWTPRFGRRGAANAANGNAPDAVRDQMMRHDPKFYTFQDAYLNQIANFDLQNAFLEEEMENQLFRVFAHVGLTRDRRATRDMVPAEVWANLPPDPEITAPEEQRAELKQGQYQFRGLENESQIRKLTDTIRTKRAQHEKKIVEEYRRYYFYHSPTWELERQARGEQTQEYAEPAVDLLIPERARLAELLCHQPKDLTNEQLFQRRVEVLDLHEAGPEAGCEPAPDPFPLLMDTNQCPECFGDERLTPGQRKFRYCRPTKRNDHFDDQHLQGKELAEQLRQRILCNSCKVMLESVDHFRTHVQLVHGIKLRPSDEAQKRRARKHKLRRSRPKTA
ncbi:FluG domain-containing protein [Penicillium maclennaniae]|uniref:FluG domain-containing protein n=1 Tax=Penicillium maclennaniae TaxID=1343394 RepID=UPI002541F5CD|nr:FluG domain-containing protein [Penicillium maclennaniae]KAJ5681616.1 FluG domain-containing protein [Penicillium maclennaniae]